ncbi:MULTISPECIES: polyamine aminopropyltransferase [Clostridium]|uniref:Polyamine aminopropyltransferase n=1 Tax=Clostridium cibarium TaxID=2762247 RepID=A0ABR8PW14_9CLOT|nr:MULTISPECIES: polyamine aminopropyltransferase [Clostridium]MBD7912324.1 polyamine aminopropyltransferase [Clostridium cibarium]
MELWYSENQTDNVKFSMRVKETLFSKKSPFQQIDVIDTYDFGRVLVIDGWTMITEKDEFIYHEMITHVPMTVNPNIKNVLVIGAGDGGTVRELTRFPSIEHIDMVELDEEVVNAAFEHLPFTSSKLKDEKVSLYFEDGIKFVEGLENKYDLIIVDSTDPIGPGEGLFTVEFYKNCYKALTENGILVNQGESPYYDMNRREMKRSNKKLKEIFPICEVYQYVIPTYPSGYWFFGFASKKLHPVKDYNEEYYKSLNLKDRYYNSEVHKAAFALPNYVKELLEE